ncbi:MAG: hypothetical protein GEV09_07640 [Pseudonocardiaceae bacterium]|nr:hypothetical protein [Pseudonocardiaceae bacterium]
MTGDIFALVLLGLITLVVVVVIWQVFSIARAKVSARREEAYQKLAEQATEAQRSIADDLSRATGELTEVRQRVAAMEKLLREVE